MIIGLTGGIATGKSTVSQILRNQGIPVVDADIISREVVMPGKEAYAKIVASFGADILCEDKTINRARLGEIIFNDSVQRNVLNDIVHPAVRKEMRLQAESYLKSGESRVVMDIPLLFESKLTHMVDRTWLVYAKPEIQLERLMLRDDFTEQQALSRIQSQMPIDEKKILADIVIENNGSLTELESKILELLYDTRNRP
ncbi:dephospho-CoA kinase [Fictibacillus phosphorivorans]|uniref:Dephospho-CoA kinase n=1 Tax=Fictibacillus phosphorivorans TaxID=1221500 RepID=A0A165N4A2_9BACL|nr:dephospho-CoA kinase [Fictibacillus phosphorivorans]KZE64544.1 dephospho-CoA kinase [Fictibacillus phosphorivorans]